VAADFIDASDRKIVKRIRNMTEAPRSGLKARSCIVASGAGKDWKSSNPHETGGLV
jgi:hypothetical protein